RPVDFAAAAEQAAQREVRLYGLVIDADHLQEMLQGLVRLLVQKECEALEVIHVERRWGAFPLFTLAEAAECPARGDQQQEQPGKEKGRFSRHRTGAGYAGC